MDKEGHEQSCMDTFPKKRSVACRNNKANCDQATTIVVTVLGSIVPRK